MSWTHTRSLIATTLQRDPNADVTELRQQLKAERLEDYVRRTVNEAPPLNAEQRARIARLIAPAPARLEYPNNSTNSQVGGGLIAS